VQLRAAETVVGPLAAMLLAAAVDGAGAPTGHSKPWPTLPMWKP
jgi:hypothetical protein